MSMKSVTWPSRARSKRFETLPPITSPNAAGSTGWRAAERAKNDEHPDDRRAVTTIDDGCRAGEQPERDARVLDVMDRQRPGDVHGVVERHRRCDHVLRHLVGRDRGPRDERQSGPLLRIGTKRALRDRHRREPIGRGADADVVSH